MNTVFIYALNDPTRNHLGKTRYIGKSTDPYDRYEKHLKFNYREKTHKANWIRSLLQIGQTPILEILDEVPEAEWQMWEKEWIRLYRALGFRLTNISEGGDGGCPKHSIETRAKLRAANSGKNHPMFGKSPSPETRAKLRAANLGKSLSPETREKISAALSGEKSPMFGKTPSAETRARMRVANREAWIRRKARHE